jgi:hypothetical protein
LDGKIRKKVERQFDSGAQIAEVKNKIGLIANRKTETVAPPDRKGKAIYTPRSTPKPIEEQKAELQRRGLIK